MNTFYTILGIIFAIAILSIGVMASFAWALDSWRQGAYMRHHRQKEIACRELAHDVESISWWFTESDHATKALQELARYMSANGCISADPIRHEWRKIIKPIYWESGIVKEVNGKEPSNG
jgi:hypothetical protein